MDSSELTLSLTPIGEDTAIIGVTGELSVYSAPQLREAAVELINAGKFHLIIDMDRTDFLDSTGIGVLAGALKRVRVRDGWLRIICSDERILKIFRITGLIRVFPIFSTLPEAMAWHSLLPPPRKKAIGGDYVRLYLPDAEGHEEVERAVIGLAEALNAEILHAFEPIIRSYFREFLARIKRSPAIPAFEEQAPKIVRALDNHLVNKGQSEIDLALADAVAKLASAVGSKDAVIQVGSIFFVQFQSCIAARNLTQGEVQHLERNPVLLTDPGKALHHLQALKSQDYELESQA